MEKSEENIAGVLIPALAVKEFEDNDNAMSQIGLERGGHSIQKCREKFRSILTLLVEIAGLQVILDKIEGFFLNPRRENQSYQQKSQRFGARRHSEIHRSLQIH